MLGRLLGREHDSIVQSGVEAPRLLKRSLSRSDYCCCCVLCAVLLLCCGVLVVLVVCWLCVGCWLLVVGCRLPVVCCCCCCCCCCFGHGLTGTPCVFPHSATNQLAMRVAEHQRVRLPASSRWKCVEFFHGHRRPPTRTCLRITSGTSTT